MVLVGLGWAACYLGATAVISDLTTAEERAARSAPTTFHVARCRCGVLASGFVLESSGLGLVGIVMAA